MSRLTGSEKGTILTQIRTLLPPEGHDHLDRLEAHLNEVDADDRYLQLIAKNTAAMTLMTAAHQRLVDLTERLVDSDERWSRSLEAITTSPRTAWVATLFAVVLILALAAALGVDVTSVLPTLGGPGE